MNWLICRVKPIPLELLLVSAPDETTGQTSRPSGKSQAKTLTKKNSFTKNQPPAAPAIAVPKSSKDGFSITFVHLGRHYYQLTLWASTQVNRRKWLEVIQKQQEAMRERSLVFDTVTLSEGFFVGASNRVNCAAPFGKWHVEYFGSYANKIYKIMEGELHMGLMMVYTSPTFGTPPGILLGSLASLMLPKLMF